MIYGVVSYLPLFTCRPLVAGRDTQPLLSKLRGYIFFEDVLLATSAFLDAGSWFLFIFFCPVSYFSGDRFVLGAPRGGTLADVENTQVSPISFEFHGRPRHVPLCGDEVDRFLEYFLASFFASH